MLLYVKLRKERACSIFIINASLWKIFASYTFVLVNERFCLHIQKRLFVYENVYTNIKELIQLGALVAMRDMNVSVRSHATWSASCWEKNIF